MGEGDGPGLRAPADEAGDWPSAFPDASFGLATSFAMRVRMRSGLNSRTQMMPPPMTNPITPSPKERFTQQLPRAERLSARKMLAIGMLASAALNVVFGFGTAVWFFVFVWACNGYAQSMGWTPCVRVIGNWIPVLRRGRAIGIGGTGYQITLGLTYFVSGLAVWLLGRRVAGGAVPGARGAAGGPARAEAWFDGLKLAAAAHDFPHG